MYSLTPWPLRGWTPAHSATAPSAIIASKHNRPKTTRIPLGKLKTERLFPLVSVLSKPGRANQVRARPTTAINGRCAQGHAGAATKTLPQNAPHQQLRLHQSGTDYI